MTPIPPVPPPQLAPAVPDAGVGASSASIEATMVLKIAEHLAANSQADLDVPIAPPVSGKPVPASVVAAAAAAVAPQVAPGPPASSSSSSGAASSAPVSQSQAQASAPPPASPGAGSKKENKEYGDRRLKLKVAILKHYAKNPKLNARKLMEWAQQQFPECKFSDRAIRGWIRRWDAKEFSIDDVASGVALKTGARTRLLPEQEKQIADLCIEYWDQEARDGTMRLQSFGDFVTLVHTVEQRANPHLTKDNLRPVSQNMVRGFVTRVNEYVAEKSSHVEKLKLLLRGSGTLSEEDQREIELQMASSTQAKQRMSDDSADEAEDVEMSGTRGSAAARSASSSSASSAASSASVKGRTRGAVAARRPVAEAAADKQDLRRENDNLRAQLRKSHDQVQQLQDQVQKLQQQLVSLQGGAAAAHPGGLPQGPEVGSISVAEVAAAVVSSSLPGKLPPAGAANGRVIGRKRKQAEPKSRA